MKKDNTNEGAFIPGDAARMGLAFDYRFFFTNETYSKCLRTISSAESSGKNPNEEAQSSVLAAAAIYATLIYYIYPARPRFKKEIDSNKELSENFAKAKKWIDENNFADLADNFVDNILSSTDFQGAV
ncbi:MAG: hypothetical protein NT051_07065 [Candidatus Micrarchaeota archaeon]|nr:hypothetical protein [Candidatus Micrarchaeota archaeon]